MSNELMQALIDLEKERGIPKAALIEAIRMALNTPIKRTSAPRRTSTSR
jgi:N utilization substance protein A